MYSATNLIWIDLEMTGLDPVTDTIIEIATIVTNSRLDILAEGPTLAITTAANMLAGMDAWNQKQHSQSGLLQRVQESSCSMQSAEEQTLQFLRQWVPENTSPMCGNSICQDRRFLFRLMPQLERYFHYRHIDVSTIKELYLRWLPDAPAFKKQSRHLALQDIRDSIAELHHYQEHFFKC